MKSFPPPYFFNLSSFKFASLFSNCTHVWEALNKINDFLLSHKLGTISGFVSDQAYLVNPETILIGQGTVVEPGAYIKGPCIIGDHCTVRHGAYIRGNVITGDHCVIGHDTEIKNSIMLNGSKAAHFAYLGDSILGNGVNLGAGTKCANLRLDREFISVFSDGEWIDTGLRKLGAILGDQAEIGCNSATNPGTLFGQNVKCYPCINVGGFVPSNSVIKPCLPPQIILK